MNTQKLNNLVISLEEISARMHEVGVEMSGMKKDYPVIYERGIELAGAAFMALEWADCIHAELENEVGK